MIETLIKFIEGTVKLRVNRDKSGVFRPNRAKCLGYTFVGATGAPRVHLKSLKRLEGHLLSFAGDLPARNHRKTESGSAGVEAVLQTRRTQGHL